MENSLTITCKYEPCSKVVIVTKSRKAQRYCSEECRRLNNSYSSDYVYKGQPKAWSDRKAEIDQTKKDVAGYFAGDCESLLI